jgi:hypothetical protein
VSPFAALTITSTSIPGFYAASRSRMIAIYFVAYASHRLRAVSHSLSSDMVRIGSPIMVIYFAAICRIALA